jgi:uncharacterized phage protein (TIGR02218 family)
MTTRPGNLGTDSLRYLRGKHLCHLLLITRKDKETLAVTDHDRAITFEGELYRPIIFGALSADRREGALRSGDQDAQGVIDEIYITASDLDAQNYLGAEVRQVIVDWTKPYIVLARHRRWIRKMTRAGQAFTATLEGRAQQLQRPQAGRFGGFFTTKCQYRLGGPFCKKDVSEWLQINAAETSTTAGQATATAIDSLADSTKSWTVDQWASTSSQHYYLTTAPGTSSIGSGQFRKILSNTATQVFVDTPFDLQPNSAIGYRIGRGFAVSTVTRSRYEIKISGMTGTGTSTDQFYRDGAVIFTSGANIGRVVPIADYRASDKRIVLLTPTPFDIVVGDRAIVQVGCDGLIGTCRDKFNNVLNFGGDPYAPSVQQLIEPPEEQ